MTRPRISLATKKDLASVAAGNWGNSAFQLLAGLLLARGLDPGQRGVVALALVWPALGIHVGGLGLRNSIAYFVASRPAEQRAWLSTAAWLALCSTIVIAGVGGSVTWLVVGDRQLRTALLIVLTATPFALWSGVCRGFLVSKGLRRWAAIRAVQPISYAASVTAFYLLGQLTVTTTSLSFVLSVFIAMWAAVVQTRREALPSFAAASKSYAKEMVRYGLKSTFSQTVQVINVRFDIAMLGLLLSSELVGIYAVAAGLSMYIVPLSTALAPWIFVRVAQDTSGTSRRRNILRSVVATAGVAGTLAMGSAVLVPPLLPMLIGSEWSDSVAPFRILLLASVVRAVNFVLVSSANGLGKPGTGGFGEAVAAVATISLLLPLVTWMGVNGAAVTTLVAYSISGLTMLGMVMRHLADTMTGGPA